MRKTTMMMLLMALILPWGLSAQTQTNLTLDEAIKKGLEQSKLLKISEGKIAASNAKLAQYKAQQIPTVELKAEYTRISDNIKALTVDFPGLGNFTLNPQILNQYNLGGGINANIFSGLRVRYGIKSAEYLKKATELDYDNDKSAVTFNIVNAYYNLYKVRESSALVTENIKLVNDRLTDIQKHMEQGLATENDVARTQLELSNFNLDKIDIDNNIKVANYNMTIMLGLSADTEIIPDSTGLGVARDLQPLDDYIQMALTNRADLKANDIMRQYSTNNIKVSKSGYYPTLTAGFGYYATDPNMRVFPQTDKLYATWSAGATLSYNITGAYATRHQVQEAKALLTESTAQYDDLSDKIKMDINSAYVTYKQSLDRIKVSTEAVQQATTNYNDMQSKYRNETALMTDLQDADVLLLQAKLSLLNAKADAEVAYQQLLKATGTNLK